MSRDANYEPKGYEKVTALSAAKSLTPPAGSRFALLKTETQSVRWRDDGTAPTASEGILIDIGDEFWYTGKLKRIQFIETAASATLFAAYYS